MNWLSITKFFIKLDVITVFNHLCVKESEKWKTIFLIHYELYESLILSFELHNALIKFQSYINKILQDFLDVFCSVYMNNILIYSNTLKKHKIHVHQVFDCLWDVSLQLDILKCKFYKKKVLYLELIVERNKVWMNPVKVVIIKKWSRSQNKKDVQFFIGFVNFYRWFITDFSKIVTLLITLTGLNLTWE